MPMATTRARSMPLEVEPMPSGQLRVVSLDPDVKSHFGHYLAFEKTLAKECMERGIEYLVLGSLEAEPAILRETRLVPTFDRHSWRPFATGRLAWLRDGWSCAADFTRRVRSALVAEGWVDSPDLLVFMYLAHPRHIAAALRLGMSFGGRHPIVLNLFWTHFSHGAPAARPGSGLSRFLRLTRPLRRLANVHLCVDSDVLEARLTSATGEGFQRFPMFSVTDFSQACGPCEEVPAPLPDRVRVTAPTGNMRPGKGADLVCRLAEILDRTDIELVIRRIVVGNVDRRLTQMVDRVRSATVVEGVLSPAGYVDLLRSSQVLLLPYRRDEFYSRTSGIFADALHLEKPMVGTADTWLGRRIEEYECGTTFRDGDVEDLRRAVERVVDELPRFERQVAAARQDWEATNSPRLAVDFLVSHHRVAR